MTLTPKATVLLIDDEQRELEGLFNLAGETQGVVFEGVDSVEDGLGFLETYHGIIDAVILDLQFPLGRLQGVEGLRKIHSLYPHVPVIILTSSDSSKDLDKVVQCMKLGAFTYVGKNHMHTDYLLEVIDKAIGLKQKDSLIQDRINQIGDGAFHFYTREFGNRVKSYDTVFGFRLANLYSTGSDQLDADSIRAIKWHEDLKNTISYRYASKLSLKLRFCYNPAFAKTVDVELYFIVQGTSAAEAETLLKNLYVDLFPLFNSMSKVAMLPYAFVPITERCALKSVLKNDNEFSEATLFHRKPIEVNERQLIGLGKTKESLRNSVLGRIDFNPNLLFPLNGSMGLENDLLEALVGQGDKVVIEAHLKPKKLYVQEIDLLRDLVKGATAADRVNVSSQSFPKLREQILETLDGDNNKFLISVSLCKTGKDWNQFLKNAIIKYFFGKDVPVVEQVRKWPIANPFTVNEGTVNELPFLYEGKNALQAFRLPLPLPLQEKIDGVQIRNVAESMIPSELSRSGILLGQKSFLGNEQEILLGYEEAKRHMYVMGQTGTGKTTLLKTAIGSLITQGHGFTVIDPHGDLFLEVKELVMNAGRLADVVEISPADFTNDTKFNLLEFDERYPEQRSLMINELLKVIGGVYDMKAAGGPMFELYFRYGLLAITDEAVVKWNGKGTLEDFSRFYFDTAFRERVIGTCSDLRVRQFIEQSVKTSGDASFINIAPYITSKLNRITEDDFLKSMVSVKESSFNYRSIMDDGKIVLVQLDKGKIGTENVNMVGQILLNQIILRAMSRGDLKQNERKPHYVFIDEFQNFTRGDVSSALAELRKYNVSFFLANQTLGQLSDELVQSVLGNVGSLLFFRPGINDYERLKHYIEPEFSRRQALKLGNFNCIARLLCNSVPTDPFTFQTIVS